MKNDGCHDHEAVEHGERFGDVWKAPDGRWHWSVDETVYDLEHEEEETRNVASGWAHDERAAVSEMEAVCNAGRKP